MEIKTENEIKKDMSRYSSEQFELYVSEAGWQDWMNEYTEIEDGEIISERELQEIETIQKDLWDEVHPSN